MRHKIRFLWFALLVWGPLLGLQGLSAQVLDDSVLLGRYHYTHLVTEGGETPTSAVTFSGTLTFDGLGGFRHEGITVSCPTTKTWEVRARTLLVPVASSSWAP